MIKTADYTTLAYRFSSRFPMLSYVGIQINFWVFSNVLLAAILTLYARIISHNYQVAVSGKFSTPLIIAAVLGVLYGVILGITGYFLDHRFFSKKSLGQVIVLKAITSLAVLLLILALLRYVFYDSWIKPSLDMPGITMHEQSWRSLFWLLLIYYSVMTLVISFINQVNKKYGPGVLLPLLLGRYRSPKEEDRIFMFMDLKSSTAAAEKLGHLKYSSFISECFSDINQVLYPFCAQVYQYVGDEIVVTWPESEGIKNHSCFEFFFACSRQFQKRREYYEATFGLLPHFKAGVHTGRVTAVEIGEVKRDIAYHGDTLNTAARIQSVCNEYGRNFITSKVLLDKAGTHPKMKTEKLGKILLKGKTSQTELLSVDWVS